MDPAYETSFLPFASTSGASPLPGGFASAPPAARRAPNGHGANPKIRRRNRLITSCLECRRRKLKCDKSHPCGNCTKFVRDCVFLAPALDPAAQLKLAEIKEKMGSLERTLEEDVAKRRSTSGSIKREDGAHLLESLDWGGTSEEDTPDAEDEKDLEPTPLAVPDAAYYEDGDDDVLMDLGVKIGKMRLTDRIGGFVRPKIHREMEWVMEHNPNFRDDKGTSPNTTSQSAHSPEDIAAPGSDYIAPSSSFFFVPEPQRTSMMRFLPSKVMGDRLLDHYWQSVHYMCRIVHRPSFERQYASFWESVASGVEPPPSLQALVLAAMLSSVISMPEEDVLLEFGVAKPQLLENFQRGTETALYRANFLRTTKLQTLQAFVMYLIPLCRREVSRAHSALTGTAIRLAECMGLHRDGSHYDLSPVEIHVRRMVWHQLCFLDLRTCEATGPRPQIHQDDFDTKFPLNVDDADLEGPDPPTTDANRWTDMTFSLMRYEANEMQRYLWFERPRIEKKKTTLTSVLSRVQKFWNVTEAKYIPWMDKQKPEHYMAFLTYKLLTLRMHVMLLHRYNSNGQRQMPDRLRKILLSSGTQQVECAIIVETNPALRPWAWYCGALHQYHTCLLLITEVYAAPERYYLDRIWKCLDFVFELPADMDRRSKARSILTEVAQKSEIYHNLRRVRAPKALENRMPEKTTPTPSSARQHSGSPEVVPPPVSQISPPVVTASLSNILPPSGMPEFRNFHSTASDAFYATQQSITAQASPAQSSDTSSLMTGVENPMRFDAGSGDTMLDVDWNEWDKLFPPDTNFGDLNIPNFTFQDFSTTF